MNIRDRFSALLDRFSRRQGREESPGDGYMAGPERLGKSRLMAHVGQRERSRRRARAASKIARKSRQYNRRHTR